jgi:hypothetical protein
MQRLTQPESADALEWLGDLDGFCGYDAPGWERQVWLLHAMYEADDRPSGLSYDEVRRIELRAGTVEPLIVGDVNLDELVPEAVVIGNALGASGDPGDGWHRLRWSDLAARLNVDPFDLDVPPCFRSFPYRSWPANIAPPAEGSLDREQFQSLLDRLASHSAAGWDTTCIACRCPLRTGDFTNHTMHRCALRELDDLYDDHAGAPNNIWPEDRRWFVYTDHDLWATKVSGRPSLIDTLQRDSALETVTLRF